MAKSRDCVIGVEWLATLDFRTCPQCKSLDGVRWKRGEKHPKPPLHPGCRCVLIPVTELTDLGNDVPRPVANADFEALAKKAYETKFPNKNWKDLSPSTRKKYYYQAQKDFELTTGKPAYSFVTRKRVGETYEYSKTINHTVPNQENINRSVTPSNFSLCKNGTDCSYYAQQRLKMQRKEYRKQQAKTQENPKNIFEKIWDFLVNYW